MQNYILYYKLANKKAYKINLRGVKYEKCALLKK